MSGTSRIGGYGGFSGGGRDGGRSASLARFCRGRKVGDVVSGVFLRLENESLGWALLEGEELLANLPAEGPRPEPGSPVFFRIEALHPEVVLRMLPGDSPAARLAMVFPSLPLSQEAALYAAARDAFDARLAALPSGDIPGDLAARKAAFIQQVSRAPDLLAAFAEVQVRCRALLRAGAPAGLSFFRHMPWLSPALSGLEVSLWNRGEARVLANGTLPQGDRLFLQGAMRGDVLRYRLALIPAKGVQSGAQPGAVRQAFARSGVAEYQGQLGAGAREQATDLVGRILALAAGSGSMAVGRYSRQL